MLLQQLTTDLTQALKSGDKVRTGALRYLIAAVKKYEIDTYPPSSDKTLTEADVQSIIKRQVKTHKESIEAFEKGNRPDLVEKEKAELAILETYVPKEMSDDEIRVIVKSVVSGGATQFGQAMGLSMKQIAGRAGGDRVQKILKEELG